VVHYEGYLGVLHMQVDIIIKVMILPYGQ